MCAGIHCYTFEEFLVILGGILLYIEGLFWGYLRTLLGTWGTLQVLRATFKVSCFTLGIFMDYLGVLCVTMWFLWGYLRGSCVVIWSLKLEKKHVNA